MDTLKGTFQNREQAFEFPYDGIEKRQPCFEEHPEADRFVVELYGSLALTGKGI